jgi:hypothetical protein
VGAEAAEAVGAEALVAIELAIDATVWACLSKTDRGGVAGGVL